MGKQTDEVKTMAIALLNLADDEGYFYADSANIRSFARPFDDKSTTTQRCLDQLMKIEWIEVRQHNSRGYVGKIPTFLEHQKIDRPKPSKIKQFFDASTSLIHPRIIDEESTTNRSGKERKGKEQEEEPKPSARSARGVSNSSQLAKAQCETRHNRCHQLIMGWYLDWAGIECPWNGAEGRQLSSLLKAWPGAHDAEFMLCLDNIAHSDCIAPGTRPCEWLAKLPKFIKGPLDQYWKSKQVTNGAGNSKAERRNADISATTRAVFSVHRELSGDVPKALPDKTTG